MDTCREKERLSPLRIHKLSEHRPLLDLEGARNNLGHLARHTCGRRGILAAVINQADIRLAQHMIGRLRIDPLQMRGEGGALAPALILPVELDLHEADGNKLVLERLTGELWTRPSTGSRVRLGLPVTIESAGSGDTRPLFPNAP